ncbi:family 25 glycosyltransferase [Xylariales sp. AK1849]|nr:family 25 glycosyltransferase [Xylariales sp. AK1849]
MSERTDKRDALALTSDLTGFKVEWVDGLDGKNVVDKAIPFGLSRSKIQRTFRGGNRSLGSWRAHMNAVRRIIDEDLDWALIMEDDVDWDVRLKAQLEQVAKGARWLSGKSADHQGLPNSPYGDDWDVLWLVHCGDLFPEHMSETKDTPADHLGMQWMKRRYTIANDTTVPPRARLSGMQGVDVIREAPEQTRFVHVAGAPICTFAYALSRAGAQKVLFDLSVDHLRGTLDNALGALCRDGVIGAVNETSPEVASSMDIKCVAVSPPVFFHHRPKGSLDGDSDIIPVDGGENNARTFETGFTENVMWSARNNIRNMIVGGEMESQF